MVRYIKALHSAVWVQLALIVCYVPCFTLIILCEVRCPNDIRIEGIAIVLVFFNSTLNPFLYCWKIIEVRQADNQTSNLLRIGRPILTLAYTASFRTYLKNYICEKRGEDLPFYDKKG